MEIQDSGISQEKSDWMEEVKMKRISKQVEGPIRYYTNYPSWVFSEEYIENNSLETLKKNYCRTCHKSDDVPGEDCSTKEDWVKEIGAIRFENPIVYSDCYGNGYSIEYLKNTPLEKLKEEHEKELGNGLFFDGTFLNR